METMAPVPVFPEDAGVFDDRFEKAAAGLVAVEDALRSHQLPGEEVAEFLDLYARVAELPPQAFTRVWTDPAAYCWLHRAYQLLQACLAGGASSEPVRAYCEALDETRVDRALARHLVEFKRFVVSLHHLATTDCRFRLPLTVRLPFVLPGTDLWLDGSGSVDVAAVSGTRLVLRRERETIEVPLDPALPGPFAGPSIRKSPTVRYGGCEIALQPYALAAPGIDIAAPAMSAGLAYQAEHADLVARGLRVMERYAPETFRRFRDAMRIIALKPLGADDFTNVSHSDFPGASVVGVVHHPFELADALIHEFHHNVLYALEERGAFFVDGRDGITDERYYSPWRPDPRPLRGVLHGIYVHVPVCAYWLTVHGSGDVDRETTRYALDRVLRLVAQLTLGIAVLDRHAAFSNFGRRVWSTLVDDFAALRERVAEAGLPDDAPAFVCREDGTIEPVRSRSGRALGVREVVLEHRRSAAGAGFPAPEGMEPELGAVAGGARAVVGRTQ